MVAECFIYLKRFFVKKFVNIKITDVSMSNVNNMKIIMTEKFKVSFIKIVFKGLYDP